MSKSIEFPAWVSQVRQLAEQAQSVVALVDQIPPEAVMGVDEILLRSEPPFGHCMLAEALATVGLLRDEVERVATLSVKPALNEAGSFVRVPVKCLAADAVIEFKNGRVRIYTPAQHSTDL